LVCYAMAGKADQVKSTLQKATEKDPTAANSRTLKRGFSPLQCAASAKEFAADCMNVLISAGAELKHQDMTGMTVLHIAADKENDALAALVAIPETKTLLEVADDDGCTALHYAAASGVLANVEALMRMGAVVEADNLAGQKPVDLATENEHAECAKLLTDGLPAEAPAEGAGEEDADE